MDMRVSPDEALRVQWQTARLLWDTQQVVAYRLMGMGGLWPVAAGENERMVSEKAPAFTEAMLGGLLAAWSGQRAADVMHKTIRPLSDKTRSNRNRLANRASRKQTPAV